MTVEREAPAPARARSTRPRIGWLTLARVLEYDLAPQAEFNLSIEELAGTSATFVVSGHNDFDRFKGIGLTLNGIPFAFMHYRGHPEDTSTLYMPRRYKDVRSITAFIRAVMQALKLEPEALVWQRADDPDL